MIYAVISDVHGNYPAFRAVIEDAKAKSAEAFLLLGDYIRDTPTLNEVVDTIRALPNCTAILGNGDIGVISLDNTKPERCEYEQMLPNFWTYKNLSAENINYLKSLPEAADIMLSSGKIAHLSHSIPLIHHKPRLGAFHSGDYARKMERLPFTLEAGIQDMQSAAEEYSDEVAEFSGDICLFGHNHLQFLGNVSQKILLNPGSCGMSSDYDVRAPYALLKDSDGEMEIELHRVEYDVEQTIKTILEFNGFPYAQFWGKLRAGILKMGSDIPMNRFWQHAKEVGGGVFPMQNNVWRKTITTFEFDFNWNIDDWRRFGERHDVIRHYDAIIDEIEDPKNYKVIDPAHDSEPLKSYMDKWDGDAFIEEMQLLPDKSVLEIGVGTGRIAMRVCGKCGSFTGIDISPKTIKRAKENLRKFSNVSLICGDYLTHQFDKTFNVIYSSLTFMHIRDKQAAIQKTADLLTPDSRFVLSISKSQQTEIDYGTRRIPVFPDKPKEISKLLTKAGFIIEQQFETEFAVIFVAVKEVAI
ncbi:MAG: methyltransferase domain-containing protein [Eubacteriales bacterium]|nr:methyltransferase domain-containing protein [Eubacteriales bacterium]